MELTTLLLLVGALACPIGMGLMMWMMSRNMGGQQGHSMPGPATPAPASQAEHLQMLHEQRRLLEQEIAEVEMIAALEVQKEALARPHMASTDHTRRSPDGNRR